MSTGQTPRALADLSALDESHLEAGVILWERFCIIGEARTLGPTTIITVTDLERELGEAEAQHRLDLHLLPALPPPTRARDQARLRRALAVTSPVHARVHAIAEAQARLVLICEPSVGRPLEGVRAVDRPPTIPRRQRIAYGSELAGLLAELHAAEVWGVRFDVAQLRVSDDRVTLDGFTHLLSPAHAELEQARTELEQGDVRALTRLLRELAGPETDPHFDPAEPTTSSPATELHAALVALGGLPRPPELPPDPPFVGRDWALAELAHGLDQAQIAQPTAIVVRGQRGVGKSRLVREFVSERLASEAAIVLHGAWQKRSADSRGGLLSALEQLPQALAELDVDERSEVRRRIDSSTRYLGAIVTRSAPSLGAVLRNVEDLPPLELGEDFSRHTAVIADLLRAIGSTHRPLVLVLDNLESIDASSAAVLKILTQRSPAHHTLIVMALRSGARFEPEFEAQKIDLAPLSTVELEQLLTEVLPGEVADSEALSQTLWSVSGGLPLAAWTNLRAWIERGRLVRSLDDGVWRIRERFRGDGGRLEVYDVFGARLAAASAEIRQLALRIAVLGVELGSDGIAALRELSDGYVDGGIADLVDRGILARQPTSVRFPHDSIREFVFETFDERDRRAAHGFAAELLVRQNAPVAQIAYHRDLALDPDADAYAYDRLSRLHVDAGRERLAVYDLERARWHLERALEHSRDPEQRNLAAEGLADVCLLMDDVDTAVSLYTALIATSDPAHAVSTAAKAVLFLFQRSSNTEARQLGAMALEVVSEPVPRSSFGKLLTTLTTVFRSWLSQPDMPTDVREALCRLYPWLTIMNLVEDPLAIPMYVARSRWVAKGLGGGPAAVVGGIAGSMWASLGRYKIANEIFASSRLIAEKSLDPWAQGFVNHFWAHGSLLPSDRYEEGQDMLDDAIAAYRETGDVSVSVLSIMFKGLYGRDREPAERVLGWLDEATATSQRNGKFVATTSIEALRLHILARQGRTDLEPRLHALARQLEEGDMTAVERLLARIHLAYAGYEARHWEIADTQVRIGQADISELPGVPEYCQELHLITALVLLQRPTTSRQDRRLLRKAVRRFRRAVRNAPRLRVLAALLDLDLAIHADDRGKVLAVASEIVASSRSHENLHVTRVAHLAISRLVQGQNVMAAAEHDRVARNLGRRLGLHDHALLSDFSDTEEEIGMLGLELGAGLKGEESAHCLPAAGMLTSAVYPSPNQQHFESEADVLEAWALQSNVQQHTLVGEIIDPVRTAVASSFTRGQLRLTCSAPELSVPIASGDLQIVLINLLLACRDAVGPSAAIESTLDREELVTRSSPALSHGPDGVVGHAIPRGSYLTLRVEAKSPSNRIPVLNAYASCERLVHNIGGQLRASTDRERVSLTAYIPVV